MQQFMSKRAISAAGRSLWKAWSLKPRMGSPAWNARARNRCPHRIWLWKVAGFLSTKKKQIPLETKAPSYRANAQNLVGSHSPWATEGRSRPESPKKSLGLVALGETWGSTALRIPVLSSFNTTAAIFLEWINAPWAAAWRKAITQTSGIFLAPPCGS